MVLCASGAIVLALSLVLNVCAPRSAFSDAT